MVSMVLMLELLVVNLIYRKSSTYINQTMIDILLLLADKMILKTLQYQVIVGDIEQVPYTMVDTIGIDHQR